MAKFKRLNFLIRLLLAAAVAFVSVFLLPVRFGFAQAEVTVNSVENAGYSLILDGRIGVSFYLKLPASVVADSGAYVLFTLPSKSTQKSFVKEAEYASGYGYKFTCYVSAKEMADEISAQVVMSNGTVLDWSDKFSVAQYGNELFNSDKYGDWQPILVALLNYGAAAQTYFNYNVNNLANAGMERTPTIYSKDAVAALLPINYNDESGTYNYVKKNGTILSPVNCLLSLETSTSFVIVFKVAEGKSADGVTFEGAKRVAGEVEKGYVYAEVENILPQNLGDMVTIKSSDGAQITYPPLFYCYSVIFAENNGEEDIAWEELSSLGKLVSWLCEYHMVCKNVLASQE